MLMDRVKSIAQDVFLEGVSGYIAEASPEQLARMWGLFEKAASDPRDRLETRRFRWLVEEGHPFGKRLERIGNELSPAAREAVIKNLYGHAWFMSRTRRRRFRSRTGFFPPYIIVVDVTARCNLCCEGCRAAQYGRDSDLELEYIERFRDARPTHEGAETLVTDLAGDMDKKAEEWAEIADRAWENGEASGIYPYPPGQSSVNHVSFPRKEEPQMNTGICARRLGGYMN